MASEAPPPPAGWYDDVERPGHKRYWDGATWTSDSHPAYATAPPVAAPTPTRVPVAAPPRGGPVCTLCGQNDQLKSVSAILDQGISDTRTTGTMRTTGVGNVSGFDSDGTYVSGSVSMNSTGTINSTSVTMSRLAARLAPPNRPRFPFRRWFKLGWLGGAAALAVITSFSQDLGSDLPRAAELGLYILIAFAIFLLLTWTIGLALAGILKALTAPAYRRAGATWDRRNARLRAAHFCERDAVVIEDGTPFTPEDFRQAVLSS